MHRATATAKLSGGDFAFCADVPAFIRLEAAFPSKFDVLVAAYFVGQLKLAEEIRFAACLVPEASHVSRPFDIETQSEAIRLALGAVDDLRELRRALDETLNACLPPKAANTEGEGGGNAPDIPLQTSS